MIDCHVERGQNPSKRACKDSLQGTQKWKPIHIPGHLRKWSPRVRIPEHLPQAGEDQGRQIVEQRADPPRQCRQGRAHHQHTERRIRLQGSQTYTEAKLHPVSGENGRNLRGQRSDCLRRSEDRKSVV